jgi:hypothetical protein
LGNLPIEVVQESDHKVEDSEILKLSRILWARIEEIKISISRIE